MPVLHVGRCGPMLQVSPSSSCWCKVGVGPGCIWANSGREFCGSWHPASFGAAVIGGVRRSGLSAISRSGCLGRVGALGVGAVWAQDFGGSGSLVSALLGITGLWVHALVLMVGLGRVVGMVITRRLVSWGRLV